MGTDQHERPIEVISLVKFVYVERARYDDP